MDLELRQRVSPYTYPMKPALVLLVAVVFQHSACAQNLHNPASPRNAALRIPADCNRPSLLANGYPIMTSLRDGLTIGVSLAQHEFKAGDPIKLHIWVDNASGAPAGVFSCFDLEPFKRVGFQIFSQNGKRILSRGELDDRKECSTHSESVSGWGGPAACARNIMFTIPARTCITRDDYDFATEITSSYELPPDEYLIRLRTNWSSGIDLCRPGIKTEFRALQKDLRFTVTNAGVIPQTH